MDTDIWVIYDQWVDHEGYPKGNAVFHKAVKDHDEAYEYADMLQSQLPEWSQRTYFVSRVKLEN